MRTAFSQCQGPGQRRPVPQSRSLCVECSPYESTSFRGRDGNWDGNTFYTSMYQGILRVQRIRKPLYLCAFFSFTRFRYSSIAFSTNSDTDMSCSRAANFHCFTFSGGIERVSLPFNSSPPFCFSPSLYRYTYNMRSEEHTSELQSRE